MKKTVIVLSSVAIFCVGMGVLGQRLSEKKRGEPPVFITGDVSTTKISGRYSTQPDGKIVFGWPGVYFETDFEGTEIGIAFSQEEKNYFDVEIDGEYKTTLKAPSGTHWIQDLAEDKHHIRVAKRSEIQDSISRFLGFIPAKKGRLLAPNAANYAEKEQNKKHFLFIGDSFTVGFGLEGPGRLCDPEKIIPYTNTNRSYGAILSRRLHADYSILAISGRGLIRNYAGFDAPKMVELYSKALPFMNAPEWNEVSPVPDVITISLGINDFSTDVFPAEKWNQIEFQDAFNTAYVDMVKKLRERYGEKPLFVLGALPLLNKNKHVQAIERVISTLNSQGENRVVLWKLENLQLTGCDYHPSAQDHETLANTLEEILQRHQIME